MEENMKDLKTGIQMYTIREALKQDFKAVCRDLVKLGCDGAEFVQIFGGMEPAELAAFLKEIGLKACGMHLSPADFDPANQTRGLEYAKALGIKYVTISHGGDYTKITPEVVDCLRKVGAAAAQNQLQFAYHNHAYEFAMYDGQRALDYIYANTDPKQVQAELDVYWITKGGEDPVKYIKRYADRLPELHLKDMDPGDSSFTELGQGCIDLAGCIAAARDSVCEWVIYEQDICKRPPFESAAMSLEHLNKLLGR